jgi:hypothetical protein
MKEFKLWQVDELIRITNIDNSMEKHLWLVLHIGRL